MAKTDEEEYLDSLLKSMSMDESDNTTKKVNDTDIKNSPEELDNFDTLSFDENNNNKEKSKETGSTEDNKPEQEDLDSRILNEMLLNDSKSIPDEAHTEDDNIDKADDNVNQTGKDFSKDNTDETSVEDMLKTVQNNSYEQNNDELADILALDDGMTVDDVPDDISEESVLTDEENRKVQDISSNSTVENDKPVVKKEKKKTIKNIKNKFDVEMMEARGEIKKILDELRKEKSEKLARRAYSRLAKLESGFRNDVDNVSDKQQYLEIDWDKVVVGDVVMLKNLHQKVTILSLPDKNKKLFVDMGSIKMKVKKDELAVLDENYKAPTKVKVPGTTFSRFELRRLEMSSTLDLRGYRVEEALDTVENYLDKASLANLSPVYIIHGHGTGALKEAVRDFLKSSPYVAKYRAGEDAEGGDGVSVVDIN